MLNETSLIFILRSYFLLDFLFEDNKIANFSQNSIVYKISVYFHLFI